LTAPIADVSREASRAVLAVPGGAGFRTGSLYPSSDRSRAGSWKYVSKVLVASDACSAERGAAVEAVGDERVGAEFEQRGDGFAVS